MGSQTLVIAPGTMGAAVMTQPLLALLLQQDVAQRIDVLCTPSLAPAFRFMGEVADIIEFAPLKGAGRWIAQWRLARTLRTRRYHRAYVLPDSRGAALVAWYAGIRSRVGYRGQSRALLLNHLHESQGARIADAERFAGLAFETGAPRPGTVPEPRLARHVDHERAVRARFDFGRNSAPIVLCTRPQGGESHRWPTRHFASLIALLAAYAPGTEVLIIGPAAERRVATEIVALSGQAARNLCGETSIDEAFAIVGQAGGVVTVDNPWMHVSAAFGRPQVALFGPSDPRRAPPRSARTHVEWLHMACSPCSQPVCPMTHHVCMSRIVPERVFETLIRAMQFEPNGVRASR